MTIYGSNVLKVQTISTVINPLQCYQSKTWVKLVIQQYVQA